MVDRRTLAVALVGGSIPDSIDIGFAIPAMSIALLVSVLTDRIPVVAAAVTVVASGLPNGANIIVGALAGIGTYLIRLIAPPVLAAIVADRLFVEGGEVTLNWAGSRQRWWPRRPRSSGARRRSPCRLG